MMQKFLLLLLSLGLSIVALAVPNGTEPIKIEPLSKVAHSRSFYAEQAELWRQKTVLQAGDPNAWLNYFLAARYANLLSENGAKSYDLDAIVGSLPASLAHTFEFHYILYAHHDWNDGRFTHLLKAHQLAPERTEAYHALTTYYTTTGEEAQAAYFCKKMFEAQEFSSSLLAWNFNLLASIEKNGLLLTHGDNDTYPAWVVQQVKNTRKDVKVLNINLLMHDGYRDLVFGEMGLPPLSTTDYKDYQAMYVAIVRQLTGQKTKPVFLATSLPEHIRNMFADSLYLTGLAFKYSPNPFDNLAVLKNNFENKFLKDHLHIQLEPDTGSNVVANMNLHYLPAIITLREHYNDSGNTAKAQSLDPLLRQIAQEAERPDYIAQFLGENEGGGESIISSISVRNLQKDMQKIRENLYASATEVTNEQYEAFLMDLLKNKEYGLLEKCKNPKTDWRSLLPGKFSHLTDAQVFPHAHPDDAGAPVQNISHEAALEYCKWITKVYNQSNDKKKSFQRIVFRLPTEEEWETAAKASRTAPYPWGGYYIRNGKGCFLANLDAADEKPCEDCGTKGNDFANDGGFFPVLAASYFPNDFGLYNCSGNVAEMIATKGIAKGGSWEDGQDACKIISQKKYDTPSPAIGFRVFMEAK